VLIDLDRTLDGWVVAFPMEHCWAADEPMVQLW
jgi:hypothetical protein